MEENYESTNIHLKWLENIYNQIRTIQDFERIANEGCRDLMEYLQIPSQMHLLVLPDAQYKNLRFMVLELNILISNLAHVLKKDDKEKEYKERIQVVLNVINNRSMFLKDIKQNNQVMRIIPSPMLDKTIKYVGEIKSSLIRDIGGLLFLPEGEKKSW
jgi:hypothetical protein